MITKDWQVFNRCSPVLPQLGPPSLSPFPVTFPSYPIRSEELNGRLPCLYVIWSPSDLFNASSPASLMLY